MALAGRVLQGTCPPGGEQALHPPQGRQNARKYLSPGETTSISPGEITSVSPGDRYLSRVLTSLGGHTGQRPMYPLGRENADKYLSPGDAM